MKLLSLVPCAIALALIANPASAANLVGVQAEDGALGLLLTTGSNPAASGDEFIETTFQLFPDENNTAVYSLDLPADTYDLYARIFVGPDGGGDDSFLVPTTLGATFGDLSFVQVNQLATGASADGIYYTDVNGNVLNAAGGFTDQTYYWINVSDPVNTLVGNDAAGLTYTVASAGLQSLSIGARETGLRIDALALGTTGVDFTEAQLNAAVPEPSSLALCMLASGAVAMASNRRRK